MTLEFLPNYLFRLENYIQMGNSPFMTGQGLGPNPQPSTGSCPEAAYGPSGLSPGAAIPTASRVLGQTCATPARTETLHMCAALPDRSSRFYQATAETSACQDAVREHFTSNTRFHRSILCALNLHVSRFLPQSTPLHPKKQLECYGSPPCQVGPRGSSAGGARRDAEGAALAQEQACATCLGQAC